MQSGIAFLALAALAPAAFFFSKNHFAYNHAAMLAVMAALAVFGAVVGLVLKGLFHLARKAAKTEETKTPWWEDFGYAAVGVWFFGILAHFSWAPAIGRGLPRVFFFAALFLAVFWLARKAGKKLLNIFLAAFVVFSLINLARAEMEGKGIAGGETATSQTGKPSADAGYSALVADGGKLVKTPNIYFFHLESFHTREYLREAYGFDAPEFFDFLDKDGFVSRPDFISSHSFTLSSALALLDLRFVKSDEIVGVEDLRRPIRVSLTNNAVFKFLHEQGYRVNIFDDSDFTFRFASPYIDYANFHPENMVDDDVYIQAFDALARMNRRLGVFRQTVSLATEAFLDDFPGRFDMNRPNLFFLHFGAAHWNPRWFTLDKWKEQYREKFMEGCENTRTLIELIEKHDPGALIVLMGDHGAYLYPKGSRPETMAAAGLAPLQVARDYTSVIYAVKWPAGLPLYPEPEDGMSTIRVFPYLFSNLREKPLKQEEYPPLHAYSRTGLRMVRNGVFLDKWEDDR